MKLVIIESPYAGDIAANEAYARNCMRRCLLSGETPIASHLLFTQPGVLDDQLPDERALGIAAGLEWRRVADYSIFFCGRGWSRGMLAALASAKAEGRPYFVRDGEEP